MIHITLFFLAFLAFFSAQGKLIRLGDIGVGNGPKGLYSIGDYLYVALERDRAIVKISDYITNPNITTFPTVNVPQDIIKDVNSGSEGIFFVSMSDANAIFAMDTTNGQLLQDWIIGSSPSLFSNNVAGNTAYIPSFASDFLTGFDVKEGGIVRSYRTGRNPYPAEVGRRGRYAFVPNSGEDTVSIINLINGLDVKVKLPTGSNPRGVAVDQNDDFLLVTATGLNNVYFVNLTSNSVQFEVSIGTGAAPTSIAILPDGSKSYVANYNKGTVSVIITNTFQVEEEVEVGRNPAVVRIFGDRLFVSNYVDGSVTIFQIA